MNSKNSSKLTVIELEKSDTKALGTAKELHTAILGLQNNPGFEELMRRMRISRAILRSRLEQGSEDENRHKLRALIEAYGFLERQLKQEVGRVEQAPREAFAEEASEYERLRQFVEVIGQQSN